MLLPSEIEQAFASGATIVTATARAARWLHREYALRQKGAGRRVWETPPILDWESWLRQQWQAVTKEADPLLLTSLQERSVWTRMQREDAALVVSPANMAALAESAYALLSAYEAHGERNYPWGKIDAERFRLWAINFDRECARRNWMSRASLEQQITTRLNAEALPRNIVLLGFDRITPAQNALLHALAGHGVQVQLAITACEPVQTEFVYSESLRDEITACARWARRLIEQQPEIRIGILAPDLTVTRAEMERVFRRVLMPESNHIFAEQALPFEFSLGQSLAHIPSVRAALLLLRWLHAPLREEELSWLLLSGFLGSGKVEQLALARLDAKCRNSGALSLEISLESFLNTVSGFRVSLIAKLAKAKRLAETSRIAEEQRLPGRWTDITQMLLYEAGWPGDAPRSSLHFQTLRRWESALDEMALLDFDGHSMRYADFLRALEAHTQEMIFAPESQGAPVQVMGALEASGQRFDAVWFLGVDDASWPTRGRAHPLLPHDLQRRHKMLYADASNDLELAASVTARIGASAPVVVFSHALRNEDGELRPSPLLPRQAEWQAIVPEAEAMSSIPLETLVEASAQIPWPSDRSPGGSEVLKDQAACPFRAFAARRLRAQPLNRREWGLSAAERGKLLHKVLENIWSPSHGMLHSLEELRIAVSSGHLNEILSEAITKSFVEVEMSNDIWMHAYLQNERQRLHTRIEEWLKVEAARVSFKVIACEERLHDVNVGGLKLKLRADRIDELANTDRLLIDYKSGEVSPRDWDVPRPNEPQLPLYALFGNVEQVRGALFACIRAGKTGFIGSVADLNRQLFPEKKPTATLGKLIYDDSLRDDWHNALLALAEGFLRGEAMVDPKDGPKTCEYCPLPGLCRVAETGNILDLEEEDDDDPA